MNQAAEDPQRLAAINSVHDANDERVGLLRGLTAAKADVPPPAHLAALDVKFLAAVAALRPRTWDTRCQGPRSRPPIAYGCHVLIAIGGHPYQCFLELRARAITLRNVAIE